MSIKLLVKIGKSLKDTDGAASQYQEAADFLSSLKATREHPDRYAADNPDLTYSTTDHLKTVEKPWDAFNNFLKRFEKSLAADSERSRFAKAPRKMQWALLEGELQKLKSAVAQPLNAINTLLALQILYVVTWNVQSFAYIGSESLQNLPEALLTSSRCEQLVQGIQLAGIPIELSSEMHAIREEMQKSKSEGEARVVEAVDLRDSADEQQRLHNDTRQHAAVAKLTEMTERLLILLEKMPQTGPLPDVKALIEQQQMAIMTMHMALEERLVKLEGKFPGSLMSKCSQKESSDTPTSMIQAGHCALILLTSMVSSVATGAIVGRSAASSTMRKPRSSTKSPIQTQKQVQSNDDDLGSHSQSSNEAGDHGRVVFHSKASEHHIDKNWTEEFNDSITPALKHCALPAPSRPNQGDGGEFANSIKP